jgi:hypothetical protein
MVRLRVGVAHRPAAHRNDNVGKDDFERAITSSNTRIFMYNMTMFWAKIESGLRSHPEVGRGALRRRGIEWERPHNVSWRSAIADDAEWMSGNSRDRLAPVLTEASFMDVRPTRASAPIDGSQNGPLADCLCGV